MGTIKAGTYRFNDVLTQPPYELVQTSIVAVLNGTNYDFFVSGNGGRIDGVFCGVYDSSNEVEVLMYDYGDVDMDGFTGWANEAYKTITIPNDTEVSAEFLTWFTANAVADGVQISGKWKFKDVLTIPMADFDFDEQIDFSVAVDYMGQNVSAFCDRIEIAAVGSDEDWRLIYNCITPPFDYEVYVYWNMGRSWEDMFGEGIKTINFGTEPQTVSAEFYNWLTANASQPMASITHNGEEIASLFPGQTATLKCAGMKMVTDVVVSVADNVGGGV